MNAPANKSPATRPPATLPPAPPTPVWPLYRTLVGIGVFCGLLIVAAYSFTKDPIRRNKVVARQRAVLQVIPGATQVGTFQRAADGSYTLVADDSEGDGLVFAGFDAQQQLLGVAIEARGSGYGDDLRVLYAYSFQQQAIVGLKVIETHETPGLGADVDTDPGYSANYRQLDVALGADQKALAHPVEFVKQGQKQQPWQIDGITGATITTRGIATMVSKSVAATAPSLQARVHDFRLPSK
ncbi:MAG: FMN-binding protein [Planctomycetes bacterium]|nr:FMN-binding protein [Planctomycetota bacterium]